MRLRAYRLAFTSMASLLLVSLTSCSGHPPELASVEYRLSIRPLDAKGERISEQLAIFAAASDEDGFKDLSALHVLNDENEYLWSFSPETWAKKDQGKETWIGATGLSAPDMGPLPRGMYRVVLEDLAGDSDESSFYLGTGIEKGATFPIVRFKDGLVSVFSKYARTELLFLDSKGKLLRVVDAPREETSIERLYGSLNWKNDVTSLLAYAYDPERNLGIYSWTRKIKP